MSKKDVDNYFKEIAQNYHELLEAIHELEEKSNTSMINPDVLENMKTLIEPLKENYMRISYIMYLLDKPTKKKKHKKYESINKKKLEKIGKEHTLESIKKENEDVINKVKELS